MPGVGSITVVTWALEIGGVTRFISIKQTISYCGLCEDENSSADKIMRMPISKQRNKHFQRVLIEAAKLATRECHELAVICDRELERGNPQLDHAGGSQENGPLHARCGVQVSGLRACREVQPNAGSVKPF